MKGAPLLLVRVELDELPVAIVLARHVLQAIEDALDAPSQRRTA